ncbi:MAG: TIGR02302 family protein [Alphaproteobacteria bacterium]
MNTTGQRPDPTDSGSLARRIARWRAAARLVLLWERLWPALWPAAGVAGATLAAMLLDLPQYMPGWFHGGLLTLAAVLVAGLSLRGLRRVAWPDDGAASRRLERDSGLSHRPLSVLADRPAGAGDGLGPALWRAHLARAAAAVDRLRLGAPAPDLARRDRRALRMAVALALVVGVAAAGSDIGPRIERGFSPSLAGWSGSRPPSLELWLTPPDYTGLPPVLLAGGNAAPPGDGAVPVPTGSALLAQVHDGSGTPRLRLGDGERDLETIDERTWRIALDVTAPGAATTELPLAVSQGKQILGRWTIAVVPDQAPTVSFAQPPEAGRRNALRLDYSATDDHGVVAVAASIARPAAEAAARDVPLRIDLPVPARGAGSVAQTTWHDLTAHPWAGFPVEVTLEAQDAIEQVGRSDTLAVVLPEHTFAHPVARAIIEQRKALVRAPEQRLHVVVGLAAIAGARNAYDADLAVYLALAVARGRLLHDRGDGAIDAVQSLLWDIALHVEDGGVSLAERELRDLQRQLQEALERGASDEEIEKLMAQLREALDRFLQALAEQVQRRIANGEQPQPADPDARAVSRDELQRMLDQAERLARSGARDSARQLLEQLQSMLENLQAAPFAMQQPQRGGGEAEQAMQELQDMIRRQQQMLDRSFQQQQRGERPGAGDAAEQEALRRQLGDFMRRLGEMNGDIPGQLGSAEQQMRDARDALGRGQSGEAVGPQGQALDMLRQGARSAAQMLSRRGPGFGPAEGYEEMEPGEEGRDPLGRPLPGTAGFDTGTVRIPEEADLQRAHEILMELRERAGDRARPQDERDYIERLLRQF